MQVTEIQGKFVHQVTEIQGKFVHQVTEFMVSKRNDERKCDFWGKMKERCMYVYKS
jgi:hypothetical protein